MLDSQKEINELVLVLMDSTCKYVAIRIQNERNRFAYLRAMSRCYSVCNDPYNKNDLAKIKLDLLKVLHDSVRGTPPRFEIFSDTNKYYRLGIEHALDIVGSLIKRFDGDHPFMIEVNPRSILELYSCEIQFKKSKYSY